MNTALQVINVELNCVFLSGMCLAPVYIIATAMHVKAKRALWFNMVAWGALAVCIYIIAAVLLFK